MIHPIEGLRNIKKNCVGYSMLFHNFAQGLIAAVIDNVDAAIGFRNGIGGATQLKAATL